MIMNNNLIYMLEKTVVAVVLAVMICAPARSQEISWSRKKIDGSRTGVVASNAENFDEAMGRISGNKYIAPNGKTFKKCCGVTYRVAKALIDAQEEMKDVKKVIGYSADNMVRKYPESELSNWFIDALMKWSAEKTGKKIDVGITNFGGLRVNMPKGDIMLDDMMSMFPFRNKVCYLALKGKYIREIAEKMAETSFQILGGIRCEARGNKLTSLTIGGEPVDDAKTYGVCTISFLLDGGDNLYLAKNASEVIILDDYIFDVMIKSVKDLEGKPLKYETDGRVRIFDENGKEIMPIIL